jgi:hypothetical protein
MAEGEARLRDKYAIAGVGHSAFGRVPAELDEGPRMLSNVVGVPPGGIRDMPVRVTFELRRGGIPIPQFVPIEPRSDARGGPTASPPDSA